MTEYVKCRDCRYAKPIKTAWQLWRGTEPTYAVCKMHDFLVKPAGVYGCIIGEEKAEAAE